MSMTNEIQLEFAFMRDDERRALLALAITSLDFKEYEFHRRRYDRLFFYHLTTRDTPLCIETVSE